MFADEHLVYFEDRKKAKTSILRVAIFLDDVSEQGLAY